MRTAPGLNERMDLLPLALSLSDFGVCFGEGAARPIRFLFSDIGGAGDQWPSGDRAAELGGRC
jgi:hypothetical protein